MPAATAALPADLPLDLLRDVSHRLHTATDYVRFHAVCKTWRDALLPQGSRPALLPWLVSEPDITDHRKARCVFSSVSGSRAAGTEIRIRARSRWAIGTDDGGRAAACSLFSHALCRESPPWGCEPATVVPTQAVGGGVGRSGRIDGDAAGKELQARYYVESRGERFWVFVQVKTDSDFYKDYSKRGAADLASLPGALVVTVYALQDDGWVERDVRTSLADRVLFLGRRGSFAVDAARFGVDGCAYFVDRRPLYGGVWNKLPVNRCRVYRYSFHDHKAELVEQLPPQWNDHLACMWVTPQPTIASNNEIREKIEPSRRKTT